MHTFIDESIPYDDRPYELLFRDDEWTEVGRIRFEKRKDNPYQNYESRRKDYGGRRVSENLDRSFIS
jgi:hypothetical protein